MSLGMSRFYFTVHVLKEIRRGNIKCKKEPLPEKTHHTVIFKI